MKGGIILITRDRKERLCRENRTLLELVFYMGKGIMYKQHILRYMNEFEGLNEIDISKVLGELNENEIIDYHNFLGTKIIKLKKYAVYFLLEKDREDVSSIQFTAGKAYKSAFLNQIILQNAEILKRRISNLRELINLYLRETTYFAKDKESFYYLKHQIYNGWCTPYAEQEIQNLILAKQQSHLFVTTKKKVQSSYNLNSIQASSIYLGLKRTTISGRTFLFVDVLDINGLITGKKFADKVNTTMDYLNQLFNRKKIGFHFTLYVQSKERKEFLQKHSKKINTDILNHCKEEVRWEIKNLDLERTLFKNQKVLLNV